MSKQTSSERTDSAQVGQQPMPISFATAHGISESEITPFMPEVPTTSEHNASTPSTAVTTTNPTTSGQLLIMLCNNLRFWTYESLGRKKAESWAFFQSVSPDANIATGIELNLKCCICNGGLRWRRKNGTSCLINHVVAKHKDLLLAFCAANAHSSSSSVRRSKLIQKSTNHVGNNDIRKHFKGASYSASNHIQVSFMKNLTLLVGKALRPLRTVECPWNRRLVADLDPRIKFPCRKTFTASILPKFAGETRTTYVINHMKYASCVTITFDLWMSRGAQDIFSVMAHWLDEKLKMTSRHLQLVKMDGTKGVEIAAKLSCLLEDYGIKDKVIAYVTDGGSNLATCTAALVGLVKCMYLDISYPYHGNCWAHIMSNLCRRTLKSDHYDGLSLMNIGQIQRKLQSAITWTKKSGRGNRIWKESCVKAKLQPVKLYTPVKTRFGSVLMMMNQMYKYKDAVHFCYSSPANVGNSHRDPSNAEWEVIRFVLRVLNPILEGCVLNQGTEYWAVSDAIVLALKLIERYKAVDTACLGAGHMELDDLQQQLFEWENAVSLEIVSYLKSFLPEVFQCDPGICDFDMNPYKILALMLDPRYKSMKCLLRVVSKEEGLQVITAYDNVLVDFLCTIYKKHHNCSVVASEGNPSTTDIDTDSNPFFGKSQSSESNDFEIRAILKREIATYRSLKYEGGIQFEDGMLWLLQEQEKFPHIVKLSRAILCITGSQIENERSFSVAGIITNHRRSSLGMENLDHIMQIYHNYPSDESTTNVRPMDIIKVAEEEEATEGVEQGE